MVSQNIFCAVMVLFFVAIIYVMVREDIYQRKREKVVAGAKFNNKYEMSTGDAHWVEVVEPNYQYFFVLYRIVGEEQVRVMDIREFVKKYVP